MPAKITWLGNAWFSVVEDEKRIHFDPLPEKYRKDLGLSVIAGLKGTADVILISHSHGDHWDRATVDMLRGPRTVVIAPHKPAGSIPGAREIEAGQSLEANGIAVRAVPAYNLRKIYHRRGKGVGYVVEIGGRTIYHAGDTDLIPEMSSLGRIDIALLPIGGKYTMDVKEAAEAAKTIAPRIVIPMHNLDTEVSEMARLLEGERSIRTVLLEPGRPFAID